MNLQPNKPPTSYIPSKYIKMDEGKKQEAIKYIKDAISELDFKNVDEAEKKIKRAIEILENN